MAGEQHNVEISDRDHAPIGAAVDLTPADELDLEVGGGQEKTASGEAGFEAAGECIFVICYRRVGFKFHKGVDSASLLGNNWNSFSKSREKGPEEEVVEVNIENEDDGEGDFAHMSTFTTEEGAEIFTDPASEKDESSEDDASSGGNPTVASDRLWSDVLMGSALAW